MHCFVNVFAFAIALVALVVLPSHGNDHKNPSASKLVYPKIRRVNQTWSYRSAKANGNVTFDDAYYWLEGQNDNKDIQQFIADQSKVTETYVQGCKDKDAILNSLTEASNYNHYNEVNLISSNTGGESFYLYNIVPSNNQPTVWYTASVAEFESAKKSNLETPPGKVFLNESLLSADGTDSIHVYSSSPDGKIFGYLVVGNGEVGNWYFRNFNSPLVNVKTTPAGDSKGIFYPQTVDWNGGTQTNFGYKIRYHAWGTDNAKDPIIFDAKNAGGPEGGETIYFSTLSADGRWLLVSGYYDVTDFNMITYATFLEGQKISENMKWISLAPSFDYSLFPIGVIKDTFYFKTNKNAKDSKVSKIQLDWSKARQVKNFTELQDRPEIIDVIPERKNALIPPFDLGPYMVANDKILIVYNEDGHNTAYLYEAESGKLIQQLIPNVKGKIREATGNQRSNTFIISFQTYNSPRVLYEFVYSDNQVKTSTLTVQRINGLNPDDIVLEELYATSKDGTKVPFFVTYHKGVTRNGKNPLWLYIYGSYGVVSNLFFSPNLFDFTRSYDGIVVWGAPRGGGDEGGGWHEAAEGLKKQKTFDDALAILEDLVKMKITSPGNLILEGNSAGGMAVGAVINQAPEGLIGAAFIAKAICDVFQLELRTSIGQGNVAKFGDVTTPEGFDYVRAWSPLQNIPPKGNYPAILMTPGAGDDQVVPAHAFKFLAEIQRDKPNNPLPMMFYLVPNGGQDNYGVSTDAVVNEGFYQQCYAQLALGLTHKN